MSRLSRSGSSFTARRNVLQACRSAAVKIATNYKSASGEPNSTPKAIGGRTTKRNPIPPFQRPETAFIQAVYKLAVDIHINALTRSIEDFVRERDEEFRHKPRNATAVDWAIRLVDRAPRGKRSALAIKNCAPLLHPTFASHLSTELNFAFRHEIDARFVAMFIAYVGGYEIISAKEKDDGYDLSCEKWISQLQDNHLQRANERLAADAAEWAEEKRPLDVRKESRARNSIKTATKQLNVTRVHNTDENEWG